MAEEKGLPVGLIRPICDRKFRVGAPHTRKHVLLGRAARSPGTATLTGVQTFPHTWTAEILKTPPLIAPAHQFTYPQQIPGEEDALARGALQLLIHPASGGSFLATCALGFTDPTMPN